MVLKAHLLCTWGQDKTRGRVLGEVEKDSFIILPGKGGDKHTHASKHCVSQFGDVMRSFIVMVGRGQGKLTDILLVRELE